ncbi:DUF2271 domain-containing protein [Arenimonas composti]|uniref:DUF2271 domain-containing protein n=1 Tax=Arenimonas composti TR7-09 = DSM 18010 TaxID=1121013 RepID=A0A091BDF2_9GAMM|nr:DUF2271 domain-containing protein [Arenimonas composti]KFN49537.1 hypothetical protein P873_10310 [Arenimonas composti TR7-09 = DSM 18010]
MSRKFLLSAAALAAAFAAGNAAAADVRVEVEIPRLDVAEYHRPYVAVWLETADGQVVADLAHWYQQENGREDGRKWLKDVRQWWRRSGRAQEFPVDGVSGATRPAGRHTLRFDDRSGPFASLAAGDYRLVVEAAREVGGRELLQLDFAWPGSAAQHAEAAGGSELGKITLDITP